MENKVKAQLITDRYAIYNSDCMLVMPTIPNESVDLSIYSPPFAGLYNYSSS
jgi:DNA modification methylase